MREVIKYLAVGVVVGVVFIASDAYATSIRFNVVDNPRLTTNPYHEAIFQSGGEFTREGDPIWMWGWAHVVTTRNFDPVDNSQVRVGNAPNQTLPGRHTIVRNTPTEWFIELDRGFELTMEWDRMPKFENYGDQIPHWVTFTTVRTTDGKTQTSHREVRRTLVPEPGTMGLVAMGLLGLLRARQCASQQ